MSFERLCSLAYRSRYNWNRSPYIKFVVIPVFLYISLAANLLIFFFKEKQRQAGLQLNLLNPYTPILAKK